ncbi:MAG: tungstate transport system ATP-binding protein, partial [Pseudomonadales bacterium]
MLLNIPDIKLGTANCSAIVGPNGSGKSLLVKSLSALTLADAGEVLWGDVPPDKDRRFRVGLLLQRPVLLNRSAINNVVFALRAMGMKRSVALDRAYQALDSAGLSALVDVSA